MKRFCITVLLAFASAHADIAIIENGNARAGIVVQDNAPRYVSLAVRELVEGLKATTGTDVPVFHDDSQLADGMIPFYVGVSEKVRSLGVKPEELPSDGFVMHFTEKFAIVAGRDVQTRPVGIEITPFSTGETWNEKEGIGAFGEAGTLYGVYRFLEDYAGMRWYMPGDLGRVVQKRQTISVPETKATFAPCFEYRYGRFCEFTDERSLDSQFWYRRIGYGAPEPIPINHSWNRMRRFRDSHPEYFALIDGKRAFDTEGMSQGGGNFCLSNDGLFREWVKLICDYFDSAPAAKLFPLCPNDGLERICECEQCQKQLSPHLGENGKFSNYVWRFASRVADEVAKKHPDKLVGAFAYEKYRTPPDFEGFSNNMAVMICYHRQNLRNPSKKAEICDSAEKWSQKTKHLYFWTYPIFDYWPPYRGFPSFYAELIQENMRFNKRIGAKGEFLESEFRVNTQDAAVPFHHVAFPALAHFNHYFRAKLLWNPELDLKAAIDEYDRLFYGAAAPVMRRFRELTNKCWSRNDSYEPTKLFERGEILQLMGLLEKAMESVPSSSVYFRRIALLRDEMKPYVNQMLGIAPELPPLKLRRKIAAFSTMLSAPIWNDAALLELKSKNGGTPKQKTSVRAVATEDGIALAFACRDTGSRRARILLRDGNLWEDDCLEIFFSTPSGKNGVQYIINSLGVIWDGRWDETDGKCRQDWNGALSCHVQTAKDGWNAFLLVPWSDLETLGGKLKVNFFRTRYGEDTTEVSCISPNVSSAHQAPEFFSELVIGK